MTRPCLISLEGGEGSGKSTLAKALARKLAERGRAVCLTREPGGCPLGEQVRKILLDSVHPVAPKAELLLFLAARAQHVEEVILPALARGEVVLCDRFHDSTMAYQAGARGLSEEDVRRTALFAIGQRLPDLTLYLDVDPVLGLQRAGNHRSADRMEREALSFHQKVRTAFQRLAAADPARIRLLDASASPEQVLAAAWEQVGPLC